jgi:hypothetical protein
MSLVRRERGKRGSSAVFRGLHALTPNRGAPTLADIESMARRPWHRVDRTSFAWLSTLGLTFWFLVGFPFGNHNESYYWIARFEHDSGWNVVWTNTLAATWRPVGQALAYVAWLVSGDSSLIQLFNFVLASIALYMIARTIAETRTFGIAALIAGGAFFAGYIYLFHLHGVFYSPLLLVIAALVYLHEAERATAASRDYAAFASATSVGLLFHPYALILLLAYVLGSTVERWTTSSSTDRLRRAALAAAAIVLLLASRPHWHQVMSYENVRAFFASYALTEVSPIVSGVSAAFAAATVVGITTMNVRWRLVLTLVILVCSGAFVMAKLPVTLLWLAAAILKAVWVRRFSYASMTASAALLPAIAPSGSPTYAIFAILLATIILAWGYVGVERILERVDRGWILATAFVMLCLVGALRMGFELPAVSRLAQPLLAEHEKTKQLELVIDWMLQSEYRHRYLAIETPANPVDAENGAVKRRTRPPTYQRYLDAYVTSQKGEPGGPPTLVVTFGGQTKDTLRSIKTVPGRFAGVATVFDTGVRKPLP